MAYIKGPLTRKDGSRYYEISVSRGRGKSAYMTRFEITEGLSVKTVNSRLNTFVAKFERDCHEGKVLNRAEKKERLLQAAEGANGGKTFKEFCEQQYMPDVEVRLSENTRYNYSLLLTAHIFPVLGEKRLTDITAGDINGYLRTRQAEKSAFNSILKDYALLNGVFRMAYDDDLIEKNPMDKVQRPKRRKDEPITPEDKKAFTEKELKTILEALKREPLQWQVLVRLLIDSGARIGECTGLLWRNVDFEKGTILIDGSLTYSSAKGVLRTTTKNGKSREFKVDGEILGMMKVLKKEQDYSVPSEYVFTQKNSEKPLHPQSPLRYLKKFGERYGIEHIHPHKIRHSYCSISLANGASVVDVSAKLGHSDISTTLRHYSHANSESVERAADVFRTAIKDTTQNDTEE